MAMTPEGKVKQDIKKLLTELKMWYCMPATGGYGQSGVPDFLACWKGRFIAIEAKAPGKQKNTTTLQKAQMLRINEAGGRAFVCDDAKVLHKQLLDVEWDHGY